MMSEWLIAALESSGVSQSDLAKKLTAMLGKSIDRAAVNKMTKNARTIEAREMLAIAEITGAKLPTLVTSYDPDAPNEPDYEEPPEPIDPDQPPARSDFPPDSIVELDNRAGAGDGPLVPDFNNQHFSHFPALPRLLSQLRETISTGSDSHGRGLMATERCFFRYIELD